MNKPVTTKGPGRVRIIAGDWRGSRLPVPAAPGLRPTPDRVRETVFNWLQPRIAGARCLDLFAGTGAMGFEAASRGAGQVLMVEKARAVVETLRACSEKLGATTVDVVQGDVLAFLRHPPETPFDIVFVDPPYRAQVVPEVCRLLGAGGWLAAGARVYVENERAAGVPEVPSDWELLRSKAAGDVGYHLFAAE